MDAPNPAPRFGRHGSALVMLDDERAALAAVLVLQEMGLTVDIAADRDSAYQWATRAAYAVLVCGGRDEPQTSEFAIRLRYAAPETRVILFAEPGAPHDGLEQVGVEVLHAPVDVNTLVDRLWPATAS